ARYCNGFPTIRRNSNTLDGSISSTVSDIFTMLPYFPVTKMVTVVLLLPEWVGDISETPGGIKAALGFAVEGNFDRDEVTEFIGQGCDVDEGIGDRERLALQIDGDRRGIAQGVRDGREIALRIVAERGGVTEGIADGEAVENSYKVKN
ncbi:MAG: hypothetical protein ACREJN_13040, partial [Nitrospiraceae bacterium]